MSQRSELSVEAISAIALILNVILNNFSINHFKADIVKLIGDVRAFDFLWYLVVLQTILSLCAIAIVYNRSIGLLMRTALFSAVFGLLFYETSSTFLFILFKSDQSRESFEDDSFPIFFSQICYIVFKSFATVTLFFHVGELRKNINRNSIVDDFDVPTSFDPHIMESASTPPPSYYSIDYS